MGIEPTYRVCARHTGFEVQLPQNAALATCCQRWAYGAFPLSRFGLSTRLSTPASGPSRPRRATQDNRCPVVHETLDFGAQFGAAGACARGFRAQCVLEGEERSVHAAFLLPQTDPASVTTSPLRSRDRHSPVEVFSDQSTIARNARVRYKGNKETSPQFS